MNHPCENILGFPITTRGQNECINQICSWILSNQKGRYLVCANPHSLEIARSDPLFRRSILKADIITPDGAGIVLASRILKGSIKGRVTGSDIFQELSQQLNREGGYRYFFLGSTDNNLSLIREKMKKDFPNIDIAGMHSPSFKPAFSEEENKNILETINAAEPDVLWVGMTAPKQEKWIYLNKEKLNVQFIGAVGAVFDFYIGTVKRSRPWFLEHGLEWLPRLLKEPRRLWYRNFISNPKFLLRVAKNRFSDRSQ
jgi:N-acetylglucosaminyldiphosphoundecaprenol N-acetyl-beta-D-mannosaminyltransferase